MESENTWAKNTSGRTLDWTWMGSFLETANPGVDYTPLLEAASWALHTPLIPQYCHPWVFSLFSSCRLRPLRIHLGRGGSNVPFCWWCHCIWLLNTMWRWEGLRFKRLTYHEWQHCRIGFVERILLDQVDQTANGNQKPQIQEEHGVKPLSVIVKQIVTLDFENLLFVSCVHLRHCLSWLSSCPWFHLWEGSWCIPCEKASL